LKAIIAIKILHFTEEKWISKNDLCSLVTGDKSGIILEIKQLLSVGWLETRTSDTKIEYKGSDKAQTQEDFDKLIELFESNKLIAIDKIKQMKTITINGILTKQVTTLLDWIISELMDRPLIVGAIIEQQGLEKKLLPLSIVQSRVQRIDEFMDSAMGSTIKSLEPFNERKLIEERLMSHLNEMDQIKF
jgi:hypothetical protein